ncbi:MAG: PAS domain S-box protein [Syntrophaceae bacterium]|nr:PAS domain S-box protein [Syntrophaceae bacterium]
MSGGDGKKDPFDGEVAIPQEWHEKSECPEGLRLETGAPFADPAAFYRLLLENIDEGILVTDRDDRIVFVNDPMARIAGVPKEQIMGAVIVRNFPEDTLKYFRPQYLAARETLRSVSFDGIPVVTPATRKTFQSGSMVPLIHDGRYDGMICTIHDVTDRRSAEEALRESEYKYRLITEKMTDIVWIADMNLQTVYVTPSVQTVLGYTREERMCQSITEQFTPDSLAFGLEAMAGELAMEEQGKGDPARTATLVLEYLHKDGSTRWMETLMSGIRDERGMLIGLHGVSRDVTGHRRAEEALRRSEEYFRAITENASDILFITDEWGVIRYVTPSVERIAGYRPDELLGTSTFDLFVPEDLPRAVADFEKALRTKDVAIPNRFRIRHKDGSERIMEGVGKNLLHNPAIAGFVVNVRDVTEQRRVEEALRATEERFRLITENVQDTVWLMDKNLKLTWISPSVERMQGYTAEELLGLPLERQVTPESLQAAFGLIEKNLVPERIANPRDEITASMDLEVYRKDGSTFWAEAVITMLRDGQGAPVGFLGISRDTTERRAMELALRESEEKHRLLFASAGEGIMIIQDEVTRLANPALSQILGYPIETITSRRFGAFIHPDDRDMVIDRHRRRMRGEAVETGYPFRIVTADGREKWVEIHSRRIVWDDAPASLSFVMDITERRQMEERLARVEKMEALGTLAGGVAHDLNNVLGVLVGYSELLAEKLPEGSQMRRHAENILQSGIKGAAIIQDLLTLARRGVAVSEVVDLNGIVEDYLRSPEYEKLTSYHGEVVVRPELAEGLLNIKGSPVHLGKTVMNLVSNAMEAISGKGIVTIRTENRYLDHPVQGYDEMQEGDYVVLTVSDSGRGIAPRDIGKIFEPFYTKKVMGRSGTGLGLAVVWGTVKDHSGYIDVQSEEGAGTTFTLYFPVTRDVPATAVEPHSQPSFLGRGESILVVDDVQEQRELAASMLGRLGYRVDTVSSGEEAVAWLSRNRADLIVLDMIMEPGMDGLETYRRIVEISPGQRAVIVSGFSETERVRKALDIGAGEFVKKPYIMEIIGLAIRRELDRK